MRIVIDGKTADIRPTTEKTVGEVLSALEEWLTGSGLVISGVTVDGKRAGSAALDRVFEAPIEETGELSLTTVSAMELCADALERSADFYRSWKEADGERKDACAADWEAGVEAGFLKEREPMLYALLSAAFRGEAAFDIDGAAAERREELREPERALGALQSEAARQAERLENFALNIQMGKDREAAETIADFSALTAKIFRLIPLLRCGNPAVESLFADESFFEEFNAALKEFFTAYEEGDTVLSGDLAEYEIAPRFKEFYAALSAKAAEKAGS
jgi:hypothetical protein